MNARSAAKSADSQIDQSAVEMRANRLVEIKKELSQMLNRPEESRCLVGKGWPPESHRLAAPAQRDLLLPSLDLGLVRAFVLCAPRWINMARPKTVGKTHECFR